MTTAQTYHSLFHVLIDDLIRRIFLVHLKKKMCNLLLVVEYSCIRPSWFIVFLTFFISLLAFWLIDVCIIHSGVLEPTAIAVEQSISPQLWLFSASCVSGPSCYDHRFVIVIFSNSSNHSSVGSNLSLSP